jgi:putative CocE/NonD family hydrolase
MDGGEEGGGTWRSAGAWPPGPTRDVVFHLGAEGRLAPEAAAGDGADVWVSDPADPVPTWGGGNLGQRLAAGPLDQRPMVESRADVLVWTSDPLVEPIALCGVPRAVLFVSSDRTDTDVAVRLCDVHPDGRSMLVTDAIARMRFRSSLEREELMEPGKVYEVEVPLPVTALTFARGHRVRISVSSSNWPRFGVNPQTGENRFDAAGSVVARNRVHHGPGLPSRLVLPVPG